jgi:nucleoside-diphosphate-sugar epimerase
MANCLVTGHKGYIGAKLYTKLEQLGHDVRGIDIASNEMSEKLDIRWHLFDHEKSFNHLKFKPEYIFHLAAKPSVQWSVENPSDSLNHNVLGSSRVLEYAKLVGAKRVIFASSAAAYIPTSPYGAHKRMTELECKIYASLYDIDTVCLRYYNVYSEDQKYGGAYSTVIAAWLEKIRNNAPLRLDGDGTQTRDFIHVDDIISANIHCMNHRKDFNGEAYDVGTGHAHSLMEVKGYFDNIFDVIWDVQPERTGDIKNSVADTSKLDSLGWRAQVDLKTGLRRCVASVTD